MRSHFCFLIVTLIVAAGAGAQPLADKVPANPMIYLGWQGSDHLGSGYADSHLKAILDQSNIPAIFNDMLPRAIARVGRDEPQAAEIMRTITSISAPMWRHPCAIFLADIDLSGKEPTPRAGILCQAGADAATLLPKLQKLIEQAGKTPVPIRAFQSGDIVALTLGYPDGEDAVALASAKSLAGDKAFTAALANVQKDSVLALYVNFEHIWSTIDTAVAWLNDPRNKREEEHVKLYWPKIRDASGLPGLKRLIATAAFDGKDWMEQAYVEAPSPRSGLMTLLENGALSDDLLKLVPADADRMLAGSFDIAKLLAVIRAGVLQVNPDAGAMTEKVIGALSLYVGRDFQKDVLEPLGDQWLCYSSPTIAGRGVLGSVVVNALDDPAKAQQGIMATQIAAFNTAAGFLPRHITLRAQNMKVDGLSINYVAVPLISPAWCVKDKYLYGSLFPQNIISAARFTSTGGKSILDNTSFNEVRKRLGAPAKLSGIGYTDLTQTVGEGYQGAVALSRLALGFGDLFGVKSPEPVIPPLDVLLKHVGPMGSIAWVDEAGWHSKAVTSFPLAQIFSGGNGVAALFLQAIPMMGMGLPAVANARMAAADTVDLSNLRQLAIASLTYASDHQGTLPASVEELAAYVTNPIVFVRAEHKDLAEQVKELPQQQQAEWIKLNCDYQYLGNARKLGSIRQSAEEPLAYSKSPSRNGRTAVVFVDGHAEAVESEKLVAMLQK